jgi:AcrR family transcriptional regulator
MSVVEKRSPGRPRGEQVENTARRRRQFIEAAIDSIVERGMSSTTLATVAAGAGLSQGAAVFYFKSKDNLLLETLKYHYASMKRFGPRRWKGTSRIRSTPCSPW